MHQRITCPLTILLIIAVLSGAIPALAQERPTLRAHNAETGPRIDGSLDDAAWRSATWHDDFRQKEPNFGAPASERTEAAFLFDANNIYIGVRCWDRTPDGIIARQLQHRGNLDGDDLVAVMLDTYGDQQRGFLFMVNPLGAKEESQISGRNENNDWNEVWEVAVSADDKGWFAEFRIPLRVLRFDASTARPWRVNVGRAIRRNREEVFIVAPQPMFDIGDLNYAVELHGLELTPDERNLQVIPYGLIGIDKRGENGDYESTSDVGVDLKYSLTSNLTLDLTANTDFAQVEADTEQINLTRFSLFFPEKRGFFLENAQLFSFGYNSGGGAYGADLLPFFSRRIGIAGGRSVPIEAGARITGKIGDQDVGLLAVRTGDVDEIGLESANYFVGRVRRSMGGRSYVGGIVTHSDRGDFSSTTYGADAVWWATEGLALNGYFLTVDQEGLTDEHTAWKVNADFTSDLFGYMLDHSEVGSHFMPDLGFVRRTGYKRDSAYVRFSHRPRNWIRKATLRLNNTWLTSMAGPLEEKNHSARVELEMESGDQLEMNYSYTFERLFEEFELADGIIYPPGDYDYRRFDAQFETEDSRPWQLEFSASFGGYYTADRRDLGIEGRYTFNRHFQASLDLSNYDIDAGDTGVNWTLVGLNLQYLFSSSLSLEVYTQYNAESGEVIVNTRLHLLHGEDSDFFIVFNERRFEDELEHWRLQSRQALVKVNYRIFF